MVALNKNDVLFKKDMSNPGMINTELHSPLCELKSLTMTGYLIGLVVTPLLPPSGRAELDKWKFRVSLTFNCILLRHRKKTFLWFYYYHGNLPRERLQWFKN